MGRNQNHVNTYQSIGHHRRDTREKIQKVHISSKSNLRKLWWRPFSFNSIFYCTAQNMSSNQWWWWVGVGCKMWLSSDYETNEVKRTDWTDSCSLIPVISSNWNILTQEATNNQSFMSSYVTLRYLKYIRTWNSQKKKFV